jgi:hypothetical protein
LRTAGRTKAPSAPTAGSVQGRDQPDTERPGDPLPRIEQRVGVAELVRPQRLHQRLQQRGDDQADGDGAAGQDRRDQPQRGRRHDEQQPQAGHREHGEAGQHGDPHREPG